MLTLEQGSQLIRLARSSIEAFFEGESLETTEMKKATQNEDFSKKQGVFVTLHSYPGKELRGCIGLPYPVMSLAEAVIDAARESAFSDPRFPSIEKEELKNLIVELSILSEPELIDCKPDELAKSIQVGKDGLICKYKDFSGLLLPQVPIEQNWSSEKFIMETCQKAGLPRTVWKNKDCKFYKFQAQIFSEKSPLGKIEEERFK